MVVCVARNDVQADVDKVLSADQHALAKVGIATRCKSGPPRQRTTIPRVT